MSERYPGYDVLSKRWTPSWDAVTRRVVDRRMAPPPGPRFFSADEWRTLQAVCARILPQPKGRAPVPLAAYVDLKLHDDVRDGWRRAGMPPPGEAWRRGLAALEAEAQAAHGRAFHELEPPEQDTLLQAAQQGRLAHPAWGGMAPDAFFGDRVLPDIVHAYYAHPTAWSEIGWGGPASPRGYVRMDFDRRDPWEAAEAKPGNAEDAERKNRRVGRR
jgi:hypothetical protein